MQEPHAGAQMCPHALAPPSPVGLKRFRHRIPKFLAHHVICNLMLYAHLAQFPPVRLAPFPWSFVHGLFLNHGPYRTTYRMRTLRVWAIPEALLKPELGANSFTLQVSYAGSSPGTASRLQPAADTSRTRTRKVTPVGFEPTPFRNGALSHRLGPLGQSVLEMRAICLDSQAHDVADSRQRRK